MKWEKERYAVISKAKNAIRHWRMFEPGDLVLVAVSGGGDSLVLLDVLVQLAEKEDISLLVVHVDHGLRPESGDEASFVEKVARYYGLQCQTVKVEVPGSRTGTGMSPEEAARKARYRAFEEELEKSGASHLATGHTADDCVETLLLRLISGAGPLGLGSIPPVRPPFIRPLIRIWKKEVNEYISFLPFTPLQDPSNLDLSIPRNHIRHKLIPMLEEEYNPSIKRVLLREVETLVSLGEMLGSLAEQAEREDISTYDSGMEINAERLRSRPLAVRRQLIAKCLRNLGLEPRFDLVEDIRKRLLEAKGNLSLDLGPDLVAHSSYGRLTLGHPPPEAIPVGELSIPGPGLHPLPDLGLQLELELRPRGDGDPKWDSGGPHIAWLDADRLSFPLKVRGVRPGDRFHPLGTPGSKKLQDFLVDLKVPREDRSRVAVLESGGEIAWVLGMRIDDRFKIVEGTSSLAVLSIHQ
jgi:tRNA(Ile)-lysidine synthase